MVNFTFGEIFITIIGILIICSYIISSQKNKYLESINKKENINQENCKINNDDDDDDDDD
jgi:hypothetical protein